MENKTKKQIQDLINRLNLKLEGLEYEMNNEEDDEYQSFIHQEWLDIRFNRLEPLIKLLEKYS